MHNILMNPLVDWYFPVILVPQISRILKSKTILNLL
ncbi:hypothetical protein EV197_0022 [Aquimarina brevivitae]|uniref:Uncharacterized protein n=1 Tax=Aquimarina brevivitae TaxID=323412 RepID=A0A4Q7PIT9_9FLAO|nr:hypothetical protein EV197_0022 [Aquimarina brevivitae]